MEAIGDSTAPKPPRPTLLTLPPEILHQILLFLPAISLYAVSLTCSRLKTHSDVDILWASQTSHLKLTSPSPYPSYRTLYNALSPYLFLPRKIFIGDRQPFGFILISQYKPSSGNIEAYALIEDKPSSPVYSSTTWSHDPSVDIYSFNPKARLWEDADLKISPFSRQSGTGEIPQARASRGVFATFFRARAYVESHVDTVVEQDPQQIKNFWPPKIIPSSERVRNEGASGFNAFSFYIQRRMGTQTGFYNLPETGFQEFTKIAGKGGTGMMSMDGQQNKPPSKWEEEDMSQSGYASQKSFRMRKWTQFENQRDQIETFFELDESLWTPTPEYPFRGIWIGDYSAHGNEFLLFHQPPKTNKSPHYRLEVIKLTGDPNVPRGHYTFIVENVNPSAALRIAPDSEIEWPGSMIFPGQGQVASYQFHNSSFIDVEVIVPVQAEFLPQRSAETRRQSFDANKREKERQPEPWIKQEVAMYWKGLGPIISRMRRVDVERYFD